MSLTMLPYLETEINVITNKYIIIHLELIINQKQMTPHTHTHRCIIIIIITLDDEVSTKSEDAVPILDEIFKANRVHVSINNYTINN